VTLDCIIYLSFSLESKWEYSKACGIARVGFEFLEYILKSDRKTECHGMEEVLVLKLHLGRSYLEMYGKLF